MADFHVGQKVVCVDNQRRKGDDSGYERQTLPKEGAVYTIRAIVPCREQGYSEDGVHLVEIVNPVRRCTSPRGPVTCEPAFRVSRFRPVGSTNIDVFLRMLEPVREPAAV